MKPIFLAALLLVGLTPATASDLELVAGLGAETPPGNIAIGPDGRIFLSVHGFYGQPIKVVELLEDGSTRPYPNATWAFAPKDGGNGLYGVLGLNVDSKGILWLLDTSGENRAGRLIGWDTRAEKLHRIVYLAAPVIRPESFLNDLAIDAENGFVYIADTAGADTAALVVVDLDTGQARRVLEGSRYTVAEDIDMVIDGRTMELGGAPARLGINPITLSPDNQWVYFGAMTGTSLYRVRGADLRNSKLTSKQLAERVERYGDKPISDGITVDGGGNVYITAITENAIGVVGSDGEYRQLFQRQDLAWPDGFAYGPDHQIYVTVNELHRSPVLNGGENGSRGELKVMRFDALEQGKVGR
ncbi:MAG: L-dopachrome tautomerase-related protein [Acidobacteriota bacterium]